MRLLGLKPTTDEIRDMFAEHPDKDTIHFPDFLEMLYVRMKHTDDAEELRKVSFISTF